MVRRLTLLFLLCVGMQHFASAQLRDTVNIWLEPYTDTSCPGTQLTFTAMHTDTSFHGVSYMWFTNNVYTGVALDTFHTTALVDGDTVRCDLYFTNSFGFPDTSRSNAIVIYRRTPITPRAVVSLIAGSNPDCAGHPLTFRAYPINGGTAPVYQWQINHADIAGATNNTYTQIFGGTDTVSCFIVSNSPCRTVDTGYSNGVPVIHIRLTAGVSVTASGNPICAGYIDTFVATVTNPGTSYTLSWFVDTTEIIGAIGNIYITDSLRHGSMVYCRLVSHDSCVINDSIISAPIIMTVVANNITSVTTTLIKGSNPGCYDSLLGMRGSFLNFGAAPVYEWYINGIRVDSGTSDFDTFYQDGDILTYRVYATDGGCYTDDTVVSAPYLVLRDSTPPTPLISLIGNLLVANNTGTHRWYGPPLGGLIAGATGQTYHPTILGYYYAIRDTGNCPSDTSNVIYISLLELNKMNTATAKVYPNPANNILNIEFEGKPVNMKMDIYSILGQGLVHEELNNVTSYSTDISYLPEGNYYMVLRNSDDGTPTTVKFQISR